MSMKDLDDYVIDDLKEYLKIMKIYLGTENIFYSVRNYILG